MAQQMPPMGPGSQNILDALARPTSSQPPLPTISFETLSLRKVSKNISTPMWEGGTKSKKYTRCRYSFYLQFLRQ